MGARIACALIACLIACGNDSGSGTSDAAIEADAPGPDAPVQVACGYTEAQDATNNTAGGAEASGVTIGGSASPLCGVIDSGHFDAQNEVVDVDRFKFTAGANIDVLVHITGTGAEALDDVVMQIDGGSPRLAYGAWEGDHGTLAAHLPAGEYTIIIGAFNAAATSAGINYKVTLQLDAPATRCPKITATENYAEAADGGGTGNDVIRHDFSASPQSSLTTANDAPEATNLTLAAGTSYRIRGQSANVDMNNDSYKDRDTYAITTGATTNQLTVRLNWPGTTTDLDYRIYQQNTASSYAAGLDVSAMEEEFETFAVRPNTTYWLWIGADDGSTGLPVDYDASLCADAFTP
jgi:hypothetical protein